MRIIVAEHSGYCYGVKRAVQMLDDLLEQDTGMPLYTLGPIIHNRQVTDAYASRGVTIAEDIAAVDSPARVVIRSHGAPKSVYAEAEQKKIELYDATCPYVKKIQNTVSTFSAKGYNIIVVGDRKHPEVIGINGWCENRAQIIATLEEALNLESGDEPVCVVAQTTFSTRLWSEISDVLRRKFSNCVIHNTVCLATENRQKACLDLAEQVDLMIVIGGKHSSNTKKLAELCGGRVRTLHIETKDDFLNSEIEGSETIGIAAGASTPDWIVKEVVLKIENEGEVFFDGKS
jgi:4-hydroxy-3-methylbut-2-enyl diphosphate reductase